MHIYSANKKQSNATTHVDVGAHIIQYKDSIFQNMQSVQNLEFVIILRRVAESGTELVENMRRLCCSQFIDVTFKC